MAYLLRRRPLFSAVGLSHTFESRCFSQIPPRLSLQRQAPEGRPAQSPERSLRVQSKNMMAMPSDLGILSETFIPPTGHNLPSLLTSPRLRLKLQWLRLRYNLRNFASLLGLKLMSPKEGKRFWNWKVKIHRRQVAPTAIALHREMYEAFAEGDVRTLRSLCTDGIYDSFRARIGSRARGEKVVWELVRYNKRAKVVSNRAANLPIEGAALRQAVVRICSTQRLTRYAPNGKLVKGTGKEKDVVEYVVIQRKYWQWKEGEWQIWGTTEETTLEEAEDWKRKALEA